MGMVPYTNTTDKIQHIGNKTLLPNQTRDVDETQIPGYKPSAPAADAPDPHADLKAILDGSVADVTKGLGGLSDEELVILDELEQADKARKGVAEAIAAETMERAANADLNVFRQSLEGLDEEALLAKLDEVGDDMDRQEIVQEALNALNPGE